jgi:hypothetical protein
VTVSLACCAAARYAWAVGLHGLTPQTSGDGLVVLTDAKLVPEPAVSGKRFDVTVQANAGAHGKAGPSPPPAPLPRDGCRTCLLTCARAYPRPCSERDSERQYRADYQVHRHHNLRGENSRRSAWPCLTPRCQVPLDFCKTAACPVPAGPFPISYGYVLPSVSPPGAYSIELKAKTGAGADLFCFDANFHVNFWAENGDVALPVPKGADDTEAWSNIQTVFLKAAEAQ